MVVPLPQIDVAVASSGALVLCGHRERGIV